MRGNKANIVFAAIIAMCFAPTASAVPVIGVAVDNFTDQNVVGSTEVRMSTLGSTPAIKYYIPLEGADCTYGIGGCGTTPDFGNGGPLLTMNLMFNPVGLVASTMTINFEDLDLIGANDPTGFFESVQVFKGNGDALTAEITDITDILVSGSLSGTATTQQIMSLDLGVLTATTYFASLKFSASFTSNGTNTPEYLIASIDQTINPTSVPEPSILALLGLGLVGVGVARRRS